MDLGSAQRQILSEESLSQALRHVGAIPGGVARAASSPKGAETVARVRQQLRVVGEGSARQSRIAIVHTGPDAQRTLALVNYLAEQYAEAERIALEAPAARAYEEAHQAAKRAREEFNQATARLEAFLSRGLKASHRPGEETARRADRPSVPTRPVPPPQPAMIDNPQWLDLDRQLAALQARREQLLVDRTPLHPAVQHVDLQIAELRERWSQAPRRIPNPDVPPVIAAPRNRMSAEQEPAQTSKPPSASRPASDVRSAREFAALRSAVERAKQNADRLGQLERQAWERWHATPRIHVHPAERCTVVGGASGMSFRLVLIAFGAALVLATAVGLVSAGLRRDRSVATLDEARSLLPVPIVGVITLEAPRKPSGSASAA